MREMSYSIKNCMECMSEKKFPSFKIFNTIPPSINTLFNDQRMLQSTLDFFFFCILLNALGR